MDDYHLNIIDLKELEGIGHKKVHFVLLKCTFRFADYSHL